MLSIQSPAFYKRKVQMNIETNCRIAHIPRDSIQEIKHMLNEQRDTFMKIGRKTQSLRELEPDVAVPRSIYGGDDNKSIYSTDPSMMAPSELEFDFDDQTVSSKVYRRMLAQAMQKKPASDVNVVEGDLIDLSDDLTTKDVAIHPKAEHTARLLGDFSRLEASHESPKDWVEVSKTTSDPTANIDEATEHTEASLLGHSDSTRLSNAVGLARKPIADYYARNQTPVSSSDGHPSLIPDSHAETLPLSGSQSPKTRNPIGQQQELVEQSARSFRAPSNTRCRDLTSTYWARQWATVTNAKSR